MCKDDKTLINSDDLIFEFIYVIAMRDATNQQAYKGEKAWLTKQENYENWIDVLREFVYSVIDGNQFSNPTDYDNEFIKVAEQICEKINKSRGNHSEFYFGNAQKLINMIMKYCFIRSFGDKDLKTKFEFCHCPMDRRLLEKVWKERSKLPEELRKNMGKRDEFIISWGEEKFRVVNGKLASSDVYGTFQNAVIILAKQEGISRIEYDYKAWNNP